MLDENGKVTFNEQEQAEVNRIIGERIGREGISEMKEIVESLKDFGYTGTPAEIKEAVKAQAEVFKQEQAESKKQAEIEALKEELKGETSPQIIAELKAEIKAANEKLAAIEKKEKDAQKAVEEKIENAKAWAAQETEFKEKHPEVDLKKLDSDEKFIKFVKRSHPGLTLNEVYEDYVEFVGGAQAEAIKKIQSNLDRSTSSGRQGGDRTGGTFGLTPNQQLLASENGMSYEKYANYLKHIRKG